VGYGLGLADTVTLEDAYVQREHGSGEDNIGLQYIGGALEWSTDVHVVYIRFGPTNMVGLLSALYTQ
jgi:hypothetical protein